MSRRPPVRLWRSAAGVVAAVGLVGALVLAALDSEGYARPEFELHDSGIWVTNGATNEVGRVNAEIDQLDAKAKAGADEFDVLQSASTVIVWRKSTGRLAVVDVANATLSSEEGDAGLLPADASVSLGGDTLAVLDPASGALFVDTASALAGRNLTELEPTTTVEPGSQVVVDSDGTAHVVEPSGERVAVTPTGGVRSEGSTGAELGSEWGLTTVGDRTVVLDPSAMAVYVGDQRIDVSGAGAGLKLQEPGAADGSVLVASDSALFSVDLEDGTLEEVTSGGPGGAARPVSLGGCAYGAWTGGDLVVACRGGATTVRPAGPEVTGSGDLRFRVNRGRVLLNDHETGKVLVADREDATVIEAEDWNDAPSAQDGSAEGESDESEITPDGPDASAQGAKSAGALQRDGRNEAPVANDDTAGVRPRRAVVVPVVRNDVDPDGDVLVATVDGAVDGRVDGAQVAVVADGQAVQVRPDPDRRGEIVFTYTVSDGELTSQATVRVRVFADSEQSPPTTQPDRAEVEAGESVAVDVLANDSDPEGDAIFVDSATSLDPTASVTFDPSGAVTVTAGPSAGSLEVSYVAVDDRGGKSPGTLNVRVVANGSPQPPVPGNDHLDVVVGRPATIDLLANDRDANGDALRLGALEPDVDLTAAVVSGGVVSVTAAAKGSFKLYYEVTDGTSPAVLGVLRVDAVEVAEGNHPPVAVRDDVQLVVGQSRLVGVLSNDVDVDGDVLIVLTATSSNPQVSVSVVGQRDLRLTAEVALAEAAVVTYRVTDGQETVEGIVVVSTAGTVPPDQAPRTSPDSVRVRVGGSVVVALLDNDVDPDGTALSLIAPSDGWALDPAVGVLDVVDGTQLRLVVASGAKPGTTTVAYWAQDASGNTAPGELVVHVVDAAAENQLPQPRTVEARVVAGQRVTVVVPLVGVDPDGDVVTLEDIGVPQGQAKGRVVERAGDRFVYEAFADAGGTDRFTYTVVDTLGGRATADIRVGIAPATTANRPPSAADDEMSVRPGAEVAIPVLDNDSDPDGDPLSLVEETVSVTRGSLSLDGDQIRYQAPGDAAEGDKVSFIYTVTDGRGGTDTAVVVVTVRAAAGVAPRAVNDLAPAARAGEQVVLNVLDNDVDPDGPHSSLRAEAVTADGLVTIGADGRFELTMPERAVTVLYRVVDGDGLSSTALVTVPLASGNRPPVAAYRTVEVEVGQSVTLRVSGTDGLASDPDGDQLTVAVVSTRGVSATASAEGTSVTITADGSLATSGAGVSFQVSDGQATTTGNLAVVVTGRANQPPTLPPDLVAQVAADSTVRVDLSRLVVDPDPGDRLTFSNLESSGDTNRITASLDGTTLVLKGEPNANGARIQVSFEVSDGHDDGQVSATIAVSGLASTRTAPVAVNDAVTINADGSIDVDVLANDIGQDLEVVGQPVVAGGLFTASTGGDRRSVRVDAGPSAGTGSFAYVLGDATGEVERQRTATVLVTVIARPGIPGTPGGTGGNGTVELSWTPAAPNGAPVTQYEVMAEPSIGVFSCATTTCTITGLTNGTAYRFQVAARNTAGLGDPSALSTAITPDDKPGVPQNVTVQRGDTQLTISWDPPINTGSPITGYQILVSPSPIVGAPTAQVGANQTSTVFGGLQNGTAYSVQVRAENASGTGEYSAMSAEVIPAGLPSVTAVSVEVQSDHLRIVAIYNDNGGRRAAYSGAPFYLRIRDAESGQEVPHSDSCSMGDGTIDCSVPFGSSFVAGQAYVAQVATHTEVGESGWTDSDAFTIPLAAPVRMQAFDNYGPASAGWAMCRGNPDRPESVPGGTVSQSFTVPSGMTVIDQATVQIDPATEVSANATLIVNGGSRAGVTAVAVGDTTFNFGRVTVAAGDTVTLSITFSATAGKIITIYSAGSPGGQFVVSNSCPDGAPSATRGDTGLRARVSGWDR